MGDRSHGRGGSRGCNIAEDLERLAAHMDDCFGRVDILVNNAGTGTYKPFLEVTDEDLEYGMAINFFAQFRLSQRVVPMMMKSGGGSIVNVSGRTAYQSALPPGSTCTGPAKAAELRFTSDLWPGTDLTQSGSIALYLVSS